jgi:basic amino acid/polyamine antiporter, APA family
VMSALTLSTVARLLAYAATCLALPVLRRRSDAPPAHFSVPGGVGVAVAALLLCIWLLSQSTGREARDAAITLAFGLVVYFVFWLKRRGETREVNRSDTETQSS